jgi:hypothetical protein
MISLTCTSCKKVLEIDDAFVGGVCRCQYCGTIQTVPASLKRGPAGAKALYQKPARGPREPGRSGSGLEALADSVGARAVPPPTRAPAAKAARAATPTDRPPRKPVAPLLLLLAGAVIVVLITIIVVLAMRTG